MENDNLQTYLLNRNENDSVDHKIKKMLFILRKHLGMEVAFISEFVHGERVFRVVDTENAKSPLKVGDSDPLEETYCKKIVENELDNIINDTSKNDITNKLDVTNKLSIGSYMGVPLLLSNGEVYGTFCCYKGSPDETLNRRDLAYLSAIAEITIDLVEKNIEAKNVHQGITEKLQWVLNSNKIDIHYQPIYCLHTNQILGFESLARFATQPYRTPDIWFAEASQVGLGETLEMTAFEKAVKGMKEFMSDTYISINISPEYILNGAISRLFNDIDTSRIVLEVTEHSSINDYSDFRLALEPLRKLGIRLAVDDAGAGYSTFQHILELEADIIKLDVSLTQSIHRKPRKFLLAKALCAFAKSIECTILAEGIETTEELNALRELGIDEVQGYLLGRPMPIEEAASYVQKIL